MSRILVTGVEGFTGQYLAPLLAAAGHEVHGIVHDDDAYPIRGVHKFYPADITDLSSVTRVAKEVRPEYVVHLAGIAFVAHADVEQIYRANIVGTRQLLEALANLSERPQSVLIASSANVYGSAREGILHESMTPCPANDYGVSKLATEHLARLYRDSLPLIVVRPFNYTGRGQSTHFVIPKITAHARARAPSIELGNVSVARDFSDVRTIAQIYSRLLETPKAIGGTYNVCSGRAVTLAEVLEIVARLSGHQMEVCVNPAFVRNNEVQILRGSTAKLESVIGSVSSITLEETLRWMLDER